MEICPEIATFYPKTRQKTHRDPWEFTNTVFTAPVLLLQLYQATAVFTTTIFYYYGFTTMIFTKLTTIKIHMRQAAGREYWYFHCKPLYYCFELYMTSILLYSLVILDWFGSNLRLMTTLSLMPPPLPALTLTQTARAHPSPTLFTLSYKETNIFFS